MQTNKTMLKKYLYDIFPIFAILIKNFIIILLIWGSIKIFDRLLFPIFPESKNYAPFIDTILGFVHGGSLLLFYIILIISDLLKVFKRKSMDNDEKSF